MHLADPSPSWFHKIDAIAAKKMIPLKITFEIRDLCAAAHPRAPLSLSSAYSQLSLTCPALLLRECVMNRLFHDGVAIIELHGPDFCGKTNAMHRITNPLQIEGKKNEPLHLPFQYENPGYNPRHTGTQSSVSSKEQLIKMDLVLFYHPSARSPPHPAWRLSYPRRVIPYTSNGASSLTHPRAFVIPSNGASSCHIEPQRRRNESKDKRRCVSGHEDGPRPRGALANAGADAA